ncbi:MAG: glycerol-3-phosphate acyltransferase [archaeon]
MIWLALLIAYLLGSIPMAFILGKLIKKKDIRTLGTKNVGATNAFQQIGKFAGIFTALFDMIKGVLAFWLAYLLMQSFGFSIFWVFAAGFVAIVGHMWPIYLQFKGGKGTATAAGLMLMSFIVLIVMHSINMWFFIIPIAVAAVVVFTIKKPILTYFIFGGALTVFVIILLGFFEWTWFMIALTAFLIYKSIEGYRQMGHW